MQPFTPSLEELSASIDVALGSYLAGRRVALPEGGVLLDEIDRLVAAGGKRLRPSFCYWGFRAVGGEHGGEIVRAAASLELLHTFAIVHDDIMDRSDERRGEPTVHVKHGNEVALLVGDLSLVLADDLFFASGFEPSVLHDAFTSYSRMRQEVIAGQYLDVRSSTEATISVEDARRIAILKSGRYSVQEPLLIGAALAGGTQDLAESLNRFGEPVGEAFQLRDDLLGIFGDQPSIGKPVDSDIREGKRHLLFAFTVEALSGADRTFFLERWGGGPALSAEEVEALRSLVEASGARGRAEGHLDRLRLQATEMLQALAISEESKSALEEVAARATQRLT